MMYHEAGISFIDTALEQEHSLQFIQTNANMLQTIRKVLVLGLSLVAGRSQISVFKAISTIFEMKLPENESNRQLFNYFINALNSTWEHNVTKDSVLCPLL